MLTNLAIRNFKRFGSVEIELGSPVLFIGPNNSGKTSAMQALALWDIGLRRWNEKRSGQKTPEKRPRVAVNRRDLVAIPVPHANLLWRGLRVRNVHRVDGKQTTSNVRIDITVRGVGGNKYASPGAVLLLDEPDAHLEILRQRQTYQMLTDTAEGTGSQIIAASHSEILLNEAAGRDLVIAFAGAPHRMDNRGSQVQKALREFGFEHYYQAEQTGWVLYLEGSTDLSILRAFATRLGHGPALRALERPFVHYVRNQPSAAASHFHALQEALPGLRRIAVFDNLGQQLPDTPSLEYRMWERNEMENYVATRRTLERYAAASAQETTPGPLFAESEQARRADAMLLCARPPRPEGRDRSGSNRQAGCYWADRGECRRAGVTAWVHRPPATSPDRQSMNPTSPKSVSRTTHRFTLLAAMLPWAAVTACGGDVAEDPDAASPGIAAMSVESYAEVVRTLSSDEFEGRGPSTPGEELTVAYLVEQFQAAGLEPGNGGSFFQEVPLVALTERGTPTLTVRSGGEELEYGWTDDFVAWTKRVVESESIEDSEMVFVGYGAVAPEYGWNDYEGVDAAGKTVVILVNDPGFATQDEALFRGNAMTYYGRWTYKFEEAARQGAAGAIIVHEEAPAGYPWEVVSGSWTGPQFDQAGEDGNMGRIPIEGWVRGEVAREIFAAGGHDYDALVQAASRPGFRAAPLGTSASVAVSNDIQRSESKNVLALLRGRERADEYIVYMAHWDHLGRGPDAMEDPIFNGAFDNATGTAGLIELAKAFSALAERPARSVVFLAVAAEEQGLLGSAYYAANPVYPTASTVATINMDGLNVDGPMNDITVVGMGASELDDYLAEAASLAGRTLRPDPEPEKGFYYRSDHFSFAKVGVPSLYTDSGIDHVEHGIEWTLERRADYTSNRYHKPEDEFDPSWDLTGALDDLGLLFRLGYRLADSGDWPNWREDNEFRAIRDGDRGGR